MTDPIIAGTICETALLRAGGEEDGADEVLATYYSRAGEKAFAICRAGLVVGGRYLANRDIVGIRLDPQVKTEPRARVLLISLADGEVVPLPVEGQRGAALDIFPIQAFLRRRAFQARRFAG